MDRHISVPFLKSVVFLDEVQVIPSDDDGALHLHLDDKASKDSTSYGHIASEGALLIDVRAIRCLINQPQVISMVKLKISDERTHLSRCLKAETDIADISESLANLLFAKNWLSVQVDGRLFLERTFILQEIGSHTSSIMSHIAPGQPWRGSWSVVTRSAINGLNVDTV